MHQKVTFHIQESISCKIMSLVGSFSHFCPLLCFSLLKVQIVFSKCSYSVFCCQWSSDLFPATRSYHHNSSDIMAALTNCNEVFPIVLRLSLRNSINSLNFSVNSQTACKSGRGQTIASGQVRTGPKAATSQFRCSS